MSARIMIDLDRVHPVADTATREYRMDMQLHLYRRDQLADPRFVYLIPRCEESKMYPARHSRDMVTINQLSGGASATAARRATWRTGGRGGRHGSGRGGPSDRA
jgi:hypothetical protein